MLQTKNLLILSAKEWSKLQKKITTHTKPTKELQELMKMESFNS